MARPGVLIKQIGAFVLLMLYCFGLPVAVGLVSAFALGLLWGWFGWQWSSDSSHIFAPITLGLGFAVVVVIDKKYKVLRRLGAACRGLKESAGVLTANGMNPTDFGRSGLSEYDGTAVQVTASIQHALKAYLLVNAIALPMLAVGFPVLRWLVPEEYNHLQSTPYVLFQLAACVQLALPMLVGFWAWDRLYTWTVNGQGIKCRRFGRRVYAFSWDQIKAVSLEGLGVNFNTTDGERYYLGFVDSRLVRESVPAEKRWPPKNQIRPDEASEEQERQ